VRWFASEPQGREARRQVLTLRLHKTFSDLKAGSYVVYAGVGPAASTAPPPNTRSRSSSVGGGPPPQREIHQSGAQLVDSAVVSPRGCSRGHDWRRDDLPVHGAPPEGRRLRRVQDSLDRARAETSCVAGRTLPRTRRRRPRCRDLVWAVRRLAERAPGRAGGPGRQSQVGRVEEPVEGVLLDGSYEVEELIPSSRRPVPALQAATAATTAEAEALSSSTAMTMGGS